MLFEAEVTCIWSEGTYIFHHEREDKEHCNEYLFIAAKYGHIIK